MSAREDRRRHSALVRLALLAAHYRAAAQLCGIFFWPVPGDDDCPRPSLYESGYSQGIADGRLQGFAIGATMAAFGSVVIYLVVTL